MAKTEFKTHKKNIIYSPRAYLNLKNIPLFYTYQKRTSKFVFMNVKIDTKERFSAITLQETKLSANMTEELGDLLLPYLQKDIPHLVLNMTNIQTIDDVAGEKVASLQQQFYENNCSFLICSIQKNVEQKLDELGLLEEMNITPTESEAWDIVQMEEIERELLGE